MLGDTDWEVGNTNNLSMSNALQYNIDLSEFKKDPYPDLQKCRSAPIARYQLNATLFTKRDDIFINEKKIDVFSSNSQKVLHKLMREHDEKRRQGASKRKKGYLFLSHQNQQETWLKYLMNRLTRYSKIGL